MSEIQVAPVGVSAKNPRGMVRAGTRKREREASLSALPNQPQTVPNAPAVPTHHQAMGEEAFAQWAQLAAAAEYNNDIVAKTKKARLELVQMEALANSMKVQAEAKMKFLSYGE